VSRYLDANLAWLSAREASSWTAPGVSVPAGVVLRQTVIGSGAHLVGEGVFERCVVWPGATARAPLKSAIVTPSAVVFVEPAVVVASP